MRNNDVKIINEDSEEILIERPDTRASLDSCCWPAGAPVAVPSASVVLDFPLDCATRPPQRHPSPHQVSTKSTFPSSCVVSRREFVCYGPLSAFARARLHVNRCLSLSRFFRFPPLSLLRRASRLPNVAVYCRCALGPNPAPRPTSQGFSPSSVLLAV